LPICVQNPFLAAWRAPVSSADTEGEVSSPARNTSCASLTKSSGLSVSRRCTWRFEIDTPSHCSRAVSRGSVDCP
jgi:hypothetical protein